jgi:Uma2 family endonuclease
MNKPVFTLTPMSLDDFLVWEAEQPERYEYCNGAIVAMVGATFNHVVVTVNVVSELRRLLRGGPCVALANDLKVRVEELQSVFYPDVVVTCDARDFGQSAFEHPTVVIEVLSPSTRGYDRDEKFDAYRRLPSLADYVMIDPDARVALVSSRDGDSWRLFEGAVAGDLRIPSLGVTVGAAELWLNWREPPPPPAEPDDPEQEW